MAKTCDQDHDFSVSIHDVTFFEQVVPGFVVGRLNADIANIIPKMYVGKEYDIKWDGKDYNLICKADSTGNMYIGNYALNDAAGTNTKEPFVFISDGNDGSWISNQPNKKEHKIEVTEIRKECEKLPERPEPGGGGGTTDHSKLKNRNLPNQHSIESITGLKEALNKGGGITVKDAKVGQLIRAKAVDEIGNITEYEPVPFMYEDAQETVIFPEQRLEFVDGASVEAPPGLYLSEIKIDYTFTNKEKVIVKWDNQDYEVSVTVSDNFDKPYQLGNEGLLGGADTGEPFLIDYDGRASTLVVTRSTSSSHTIGISTKVSMPVPIPPQFLGDADPVDSSTLQVVNGKPTWAKPTLFVSFERDLNAEDVRYVADKSYEEIKNALLNDIAVVGIYKSKRYSNYYIGNIVFGPDEYIAVFSYVDAINKRIRYFEYVKPQKLWEEKTLNILEKSKGLPYYDSADEGAILQVVNGIPTWVKLTNRAEVGG